MPLMTCVDCNSQHSTEAAACPTCGRPKARVSNVSDDGPVVMYQGNSVTAGQANRTALMFAVLMGFFSCGTLAILFIPMLMFAQRRMDGPGIKGLLYGSAPWVVFWIFICIGAMVT